MCSAIKISDWLAHLKPVKKTNHLDITLLDGLLERSFCSRNISLFVFDQNNDSVGQYNIFLDTLSLTDRSHIESLKNRGMSEGQGFSYIATIKDSEDSLYIYGSAIGGNFIILCLPYENIAAPPPFFPRDILLNDNIDHFDFPIWITDNTQEIIHTNKSFCSLAKNADIEASLNSPKAKILHQSALYRQEPQKTKISIHINGKKNIFLITQIPILDANEEDITLGYAQNITEQEALTHCFADLQEKQNNFIHQIPTATILFDNNRQIIAYNQPFMDLWDIRSDTLDNIPDHPALLDYLQSMRVLPENRQVKLWRQEQFTPYLEPTQNYDSVWYLPDQRILKVKSCAYPSIGVLCFYEDISDKIELEKKHKKTVHNLQEALDSMQGDIALFDSHYRLIVLNNSLSQRTEHLFNIGMHLSKLPDFLTKDLQISQFCQSMLQKLQGDFPAEGYQENYDQNGEIYQLSCMRLEVGDVLLTFKDITSQMQYEIALSDKAEALTELSHIREMFFRQISYQLREPMTAISSFSEVLEGEIFGSLNDKQKEYISDIRGANKKMLELVDNLMDLAALDKHIDSGEFTQNNLFKMIEGLLITLKDRLEYKKISVILDKQNPIFLKCDYTSLRQAIIQIMYNAIEASPISGKIDIKLVQNNTGTLISIQDFGKGLSDTLLNKLDNNLTCDGYGLKYVKRVCKLHKAELTFNVVDKTGTNVILKIPS